MENKIATLPLLRVEPGITFSKPELEGLIISEHDPAIEAMTDFTRNLAVTIDSQSTLRMALEKMKAHGIRLLLVTSTLDIVVGVLTAYDIQSEKPVKYSAENGIAVTMISAEMLMTPIEKTPALDFEFVQHTQVSGVINIMKELDRPHILVIETVDKQCIRGIFSSTRISKLLGKPVYHPLHAAHSLADIHHEMAAH